MPTYEYRCDECGYSFELNHSIKENPTVLCPNCRNQARKHITGGSGFIMKGSSPYIAGNVGTKCGKEETCCGKENPCEIRPCDK
ncbi:MAG: FmdB family zinc ribbon protein [Thermodesulfovibrionales bacterium]